MRKILLVIEEYQELVAAENLLRRVGFDVLSLGKEVLLNDALLRFHPDMVIASLRGRFVEGMKVAMRVKKLSPPPRVVLAYPYGTAPNLTPEQQAQVDALVLLPVKPTNWIRVVAQMSQMDPGPLLGKYQKLSTTRVTEGAERGDGHGLPDDLQILKGGHEPIQVTHVKSKPTSAVIEEDPWAKAEDHGWDPTSFPGQAAVSRSNRSKGYDSFLTDHDVQVSRTVPREKIMEAAKLLKAESENEREELERIDQEKRAFLKALFDSGEITYDPDED